MQWRGRRQSDNVEDRRGMSGGGKVVAGGGAIAIVFFLVKMFFPEASPFVVTIQQSQGTQQTEQVEKENLLQKKKKWANLFQPFLLTQKIFGSKYLKKII